MVYPGRHDEQVPFVDMDADPSVGWMLCGVYRECERFGFRYFSRRIRMYVPLRSKNALPART